MIKEKGPLGKAVYEFSRDGRSVVIYDPETPRHWYNYLWNDLGYCAQVSQMGHGRSYYLNEKADMCMLNRDAARYVYLRDEESKRCWNIGGGPLEEAVEDYRCTHSISSSLLESRQGDVEASWHIFVPTELYGELWTVTLENRGKEPKLLSVFPAVSFSLDGFSHPRYYEMYRCLETEFDGELNGIFCRSAHPFAPHKRYQGFLAASEPVFAYDGDLTAFCGAMSTRTETGASSAALYQRPRRLVRGENCSNSGGALFIPGAVLQHKLTLLPGEVKILRFVFGISENSEEARRVAKQYTQEKKVEEALRAAEARDREKCSSLSVHTPDQKINHVMNIWLKKQVDFCIVGKKGVRDNLQIAVALLNYRPEKAKEEILECLRHQFRDGYAVLTWYPYDDTRYLCFMEACDSNYFHFQICNHNLLLADAIHRNTGRRPILPDSCAVIIDEAHKLPETARQMFGVTLEASDIRSLIRDLRSAKYFLAAETLSEITAPLLRKLSRLSHGEPFSDYLPLLAAAERTLSVIQNQLDGLLAVPLRKSLEDVSATVSLFSHGRPDMVFYTTEDDHNGTMLCATISDLTAQLQTTLWNQTARTECAGNRRYCQRNRHPHAGWEAALEHNHHLLYPHQ